jgi:hypothetical protein
MIPVAHGGTVGLVVELGTAAALTVLMGWALWKSRHAAGDDDEEKRPR